MHFAPARNLLQHTKSFFRAQVPAKLLRAFPAPAGKFGLQIMGQQYLFHASSNVFDGARIKITQNPAGDLWQAGAVRGDCWDAAGHGFDHRKTEAFVE